MGFFQQSIEKRLSAMLGTQVTFEKFNFSLLGGSVDVQGVVVGGHHSSGSVLAIRRVRAEISLGAALKKEFVIKSLTIERPVVTLMRGADGTWNLPNRKVADMSAKATDTPITEENEGTWKFEARKVLVVDGEVHYKDASGYHGSIEQILAEIKESGSGLEVTVIADSAGRRDQPEALGQIRVQGRADSVPDLSRWKAASLRGTVEVGELLRGQVDVPSLKPLDVKAEFNCSFDPAAMGRLLPPEIQGADALRSGKLRGRVELNGRATYRSVDGLRLPDLTLRATDIIFSEPEKS